MMTMDPLRWFFAALLLLGYLAVCLRQWRNWRGNLRRQEAGAMADWLVLYASQTGNAQALAQHSQSLLQSAGLVVRCQCLSQLEPGMLERQRQVLFIVATYGEGDAPDSAARFVSHYLRQPAALADLRYALLALGDAGYTRFCGFGRNLAHWLQASAAQPLFAPVEVDRLAPATLAQWQQQLGHLAGTRDVPEWQAPPWQDWCISTRRLLNPGSSGAPVYDLVLQPLGGALPAWQAGDLVQVCPPAANGVAREYSIASISSEGHIRLLVRLHLHDDGSVGAASGWLCLQATSESPIALRLRRHPRFHLTGNEQQPAIFIGNGTGLAGLRAHLKTRIDAGIGCNWLIFGERNRAHDFLWQEEICAWQQSGMLTVLDCCFSRDQIPARYVQHALAAEGEQLRNWVQQGAAIYVCGSLLGMAQGVHQTLLQLLGDEVLNQMQDSGRYRRDVY